MANFELDPNTDKILVNSSRFILSEYAETTYQVRMTLTILLLRTRDVGKYKCQATNSIGDVEGILQLNGTIDSLLYNFFFFFLTNQTERKSNILIKLIVVYYVPEMTLARTDVQVPCTTTIWPIICDRVCGLFKWDKIDIECLVEQFRNSTSWNDYNEHDDGDDGDDGQRWYLQ